MRKQGFGIDTGSDDTNKGRNLSGYTACCTVAGVKAQLGYAACLGIL